LLPWLLDPEVPWGVAAPFARGLASVALEAALLVGWPVGWALACVRLVESGEALVLQTLGERPASTIARLFPQGVFFAAAVASVSLAWGRDANEPGRVATELIERAGTSCAGSEVARTYAIPFTQLTWLCTPDEEAAAPRARATLVGRGPGSLSSALFSAQGAHIAGDFREIELTDARLAMGSSPRAFAHVGRLVLRGLSPWSRASTLPFALRGLLFAAAGLASAWLAAYASLLGAVRSRAGAIALGASGPLAALAFVRVLERADTRLVVYSLTPLVAAAAIVTFSALLRVPVWRLLGKRRAASTNRGT
jgi:hypothetical protein